MVMFYPSDGVKAWRREGIVCAGKGGIQQTWGKAGHARWGGDGESGVNELGEQLW